MVIITATKHMSTMSVSKEITAEAKDINELLHAAKRGKWETVFLILGSPTKPKKAHLINCLPENRRWGVLHQAVWWRNFAAVKKLLQFETCDASIVTKDGKSELGQTGRIQADEIATKFGYTEIAELIQTHFSYVCQQNPVTFHLLRHGTQDDALSLLRITLASYTETFKPRFMDSNTLYDLLYEVYMNMETEENRWIEIRDKICESVSVICGETCEKLWGCQSRGGLYISIINTYTDESTFLYDHLNTALPKQRKHDYRPTAEDLALGPYVLMYQMLLLFWDSLEKETKTTYRRMQVSDFDLKQYQIGTTFAWMYFVSSSTDHRTARAFPTTSPSGDNSVIFKIDNRNRSPWQPRNIENHAQFMENERVYPAGAPFIVKDRKERGNDTHVCLKLLGGEDDQNRITLQKHQYKKVQWKKNVDELKNSTTKYYGFNK